MISTGLAPPDACLADGSAAVGGGELGDLDIRALIASAPVAIYLANDRGEITYANPEYRRILGLGPAQSLDDWAHGLHPDDCARIKAIWSEFCANPRPITFEWRSRPQDGKYRVLSEQVAAIQGFPGFVGTITDVTEGVAAREELQHAEKVFRNTIEQTPIGIAYANRHGRVLRCNWAFCSMLGYAPDDPLTRTLESLTHADDRAFTALELARLWKGDIGSSDIEKRYLRDDGSHLWVRATTILLRDAHGEPDCSVEFLRDISARKAAEAALRESQGLLQAVIADLPIAVRACDRNGSVFLHNRAAETLFGIRPPGTREPADAATELTGAEFFAPDGVTPLPDGDRPLLRALRGENVSHQELVIARRGGMPRKTVSSARQLLGEDGESLGAVAVTQDVTTQRAMEVELMQAQKLESIGQLAAGIAHEINTPTQFIGDNVRFLQDAFADIETLVAGLDALVAASGSAGIPAAPVRTALASTDVGYLREEIPKAIAQSLEGIARISKIVSAMKEFSHPGLDRTLLDINKAVASTITVASNEWKYVANVHTDFDPELPLTPVIPGALNQVILNVIVNAAHAIESHPTRPAGSKGTIAVTTRWVGDHVEIRIRDSGCGIPEKIMNRIFDPFFTTKPVGKGTGQGLAIAHDVVVNKHGGTIGVDSEPGVGTTITIRLPVQGPDGPAANSLE